MSRPLSLGGSPQQGGEHSRGMRAWPFLPCVEPLAGCSPIGWVCTVRSTPQSEGLLLNSASFCLLSHRCQMCIMTCWLPLTHSACFSLSFTGITLKKHLSSNSTSAAEAAQPTIHWQQFRFHHIHAINPFSNFYFFAEVF